MKSNIKRLSLCLSALMLLILASPLTVLAAEEEVAASAKFYGTFWSLVPPLVAIALALITKEVYSSLFVGILVGALFYSNFNFEGTILHIFEGGMISVLTDSYNMGILIFLVILGTMVCLMNRAGGSAAFGRWAGKRIKSRVGAELSTIILGVLIFIDDYFNCLTVGSVMRPVTEACPLPTDLLRRIAIQCPELIVPFARRDLISELRTVCHNDSSLNMLLWDRWVCYVYCNASNRFFQFQIGRAHV